MSDNVDKDEIKRNIDRLQAEHPCHFAFDATKFDSEDNVDVVKRAIDSVMESIRDDADIHIICEFAKLYLDGVKPTLERPREEWIPLHFDSESKCVSDFPYEMDGKWVIVTDGKIVSVERIKKDAYDHFFPCGTFFELEDVVAWMPLPEPYKKEGD